MTEVKVTSIFRYIGLSSDTKATTGVPAGSLWYETDTGAQYIYDGTAWGLDLVGGPPYRATKTVTFTGAANLGQAGTNTTLFTVTGEGLVEKLVPFCTVNLTEAVAGAILSLGVTGNLQLFVANTNSVDIDANEFWTQAAPAAVGGIALPAALKDIVITDNVLAAATVQNTNGGAIRWDVWWRPLSANAKLVAA